MTDSAGRETRVSTVITVGNTSPTVTIHVPVEGGTFAFGDSIPYAVTVTDPEDGPVNCADVQVTFVLGHDEHGHAEESTTGCTGSLQTLADDVSHGGNVFGVINVRYQDTGGPGDVPALTTIEEVKIRQRKQQVEHVVNQSGTNTGTNTDEGSGTHRGSLAPGDWIQLNGPFNLANIDSLTFRVADTAAGRTAGSPLAAVELRTGSATGPLVSTYNLTSTGGTGVWTSQTFPISLAGLNELFLVFRAVDGGQTGNNLFNLNYVEFNGKGVSVIQTSTPGTVGGTVPPTLSLSLGAPATFGAFTPGVSRTYDASTTANVISTARERGAERRRSEPDGHRPPRQRGVLAAAAAEGQGGRRRRHRRRLRQRRRLGEPDERADVRRAGLERHRDGVVPAGDRRQRRPADGRTTARP